MSETFEYIWQDEESAGIYCICGYEVVVHFDVEFDICKCGRKYHYTPGYVEDVTNGTSSEWLSMEIIPKNGSWFLGHDGYDTAIIRWDNTRFVIQFTRHSFIPICWQHLPNKPKSKWRI